MTRRDLLKLPAALALPTVLTPDLDGATLSEGPPYAAITLNSAARTITLRRGDYAAVFAVPGDATIVFTDLDIDLDDPYVGYGGVALEMVKRPEYWPEFDPILE